MFVSILEKLTSINPTAITTCFSSWGTKRALLTVKYFPHKLQNILFHWVIIYLFQMVITKKQNKTMQTSLIKSNHAIILLISNGPINCGNPALLFGRWCKQTSIFGTNSEVEKPERFFEFGQIISEEYQPFSNIFGLKKILIRFLIIVRQIKVIIWPFCFLFRRFKTYNCIGPVFCYVMAVFRNLQGGIWKAISFTAFWKKIKNS